MSTKIVGCDWCKNQNHLIHACLFQLGTYGEILGCIPKILRIHLATNHRIIVQSCSEAVNSFDSTSMPTATSQDTIVVVTAGPPPISNLRMSTPEPNPPDERPWIEQRPAIPVPKSPLPTLTDLPVVNKKREGIGATTNRARG
ncbi:uncharacterized protein BT62DRAFT_157651 [Guyanagaster necrorhizus]|uniref:Uncharacterized protein n=1 Tax=Guyanagaster necrorhizus TaxID=856835 RepID=A0A9P7VRP5_9AGAR|nr:uncharacterized protein BT62DRAFT_157651 [Guyanagaster necrorhizus MCA 3950]KAG7446188.1 hypothetical protein BT62DRAFT_157651 [Guyanagaster necrorhizus MCA 3950]